MLVLPISNKILAFWTTFTGRFMDLLLPLVTPASRRRRKNMLAYNSQEEEEEEEPRAQ